jgi:ABC-type amino acid transport substrate-binding protein
MEYLLIFFVFCVFAEAPIFKNCSETIYYYEIDSFWALFLQLFTKRIDAGYINIDVARYYLKHTLHLENCCVYAPQLPHTEDYYYLSTIKYPEIIKKFNEFLKKYKKEIVSLKEKYGIMK